MKKILLFCIAITAFIVSTNAQLENWTIETDYVNVEKETTEKNEGQSSMKATWTSKSNQDIDSESFNVTAGADFSYKLDVLDNTNAGRVRMVIIWNNDYGYSDVYSADNASWQTLTYEGTVPDGATSAKIRLRFYDSSGWNGSATVYVDNARYTEGTGSNLITDGGFENWAAAGTLELTTPNGGESYDAGETVELAWNSTNVENVYFDVWTNDSKWSRVTQDIASVDGANTFDFVVPENAWTWDGYKLRVVDAALATTNDESDATFSITGHDTNLFWEDFSGSQFNTTTAHSVAGAKIWKASSDYVEMNGYDKDNQEDEEDWLVTNAINLDNTTNELFSFKSNLSYPKPGSDLTVHYSSDYSGSGDPSAATWTAINATMPTSSGSDYIHSGYIDLSSVSGTIYIAFKYVGTTTEADRWRIKEIQVTGVEDTSTDVDAPKVVKMEVGPNPFVNEFEIKTPKTVVDVVMYNTAGQVVKNDRSGSKLVNTANLSNGMYVLQVKFADGSTITQKVIKK
ncbi:MAG: choice-of-anchor J domain-containing protein [Carboxylicivirga sp.]|jgi:hypothetical protein|nr:choice-of-anchor J domain-containing protein [Carboxylicivirga sp.]